MRGVHATGEGFLVLGDACTLMMTGRLKKYQSLVRWTGENSQSSMHVARDRQGGVYLYGDASQGSRSGVVREESDLF